MKRFTETTIWDKPWYRKAPPRVKALWRYLCDHCDHAGVIDVDWELASFCIGEPVSLADLELLHSNAIERRGKVFLPGFVFFQYPGLSRDCKPHQPVFEALKRHQVDLSELTGSPMNGYSEGIESPMNEYSEGIESPMNEYSEGIESPMNEYSEGIGNPMNEYSEGIESPTSRLSKPTRKRKGKGKGKGSEGGCRGKRGRRPMRVAAWEWGPRGGGGIFRRMPQDDLGGIEIPAGVLRRVLGQARASGMGNLAVW